MPSSVVPTPAVLVGVLLLVWQPWQAHATPPPWMENMSRAKTPLVAIEVLRSVTDQEPSDWIAWEFLGGLAGQVARKLLSAGDTRNGIAMLRLSVKAFETGWSGRSENVALPWRSHAKPPSLVLRGWGDALAWTDEGDAAKQVFTLGVKLGIWNDALCRPEVLLASRPRPADWRYIMPADAFGHVLSPLLSRMEDIMREVEQRHRSSTSGWRRENAGLHSDGAWAQAALLVNGERTRDCGHFPVLCYTISRIPAVHLRNGQVKLSGMRSGTVVRPHAGPTMERLRMHCAVMMPSSRNVYQAWIRVGTRRMNWEVGKCFVMDESCDHEAVFVAKDADAQRIVLLLDFANPFLATKESYVDTLSSDTHAEGSLVELSAFWNNMTHYYNR